MKQFKRLPHEQAVPGTDDPGPGLDHNATDDVEGRMSVSPRSAAIEVDTTPGMPHGSMSSKSVRSTLMLRAMPW